MVQLERYLSDLESSEVRALAELIQWNIAHAEIELPTGGAFPDLPSSNDAKTDILLDHLSQSRLEESLNSQITSSQNSHSIRTIHQYVHNIATKLSSENLDAIACLSDSPITGIAAAAGKSLNYLLWF